MKPLLCVTVTAETMAEMRRRRDAVADADLIELRLDAARDPDAAGALEGRRRPVVVTCRPRWDGGAFDGSEEERHRILADAVARGAEYVDVEWRAGFDDLVRARRGGGIVVSSHDFEGTPADLDDRLAAMRSTGGQVVKLAVRANALTDCVRLRDAARRAAAAGPTVAIAMGECGLVSRVLPARFGSIWSYAGTLDEVGQLTADALLHEYGFRALDERTALYGLTGSPVAHSVSPAMHNAWFRRSHRNAVYLPLPAKDVDDFAAFARAFGVAGASVTVPFKVAMARCVDDLSRHARQIGAVNTVRVDDGRWIGENTDARAFLDPIERRLPLGGVRASILGAGGAARAVAWALGQAGAAVRIHARRAGQAETTARDAVAAVGPWPPAPGSWDLLVNCTPVGMHPLVHESPLAREALTGRAVYDLVYNPRVTRLLQDAGAAGCLAIGGLEMLVAQAREQAWLWTGERPPAEVMRDAASRRLDGSDSHENHVV